MNAPFSRPNEAAQMNPGKANVPEKSLIIKRNDSNAMVLQWTAKGESLVQQRHAHMSFPTPFLSHTALITCQVKSHFPSLLL